MTNASYVTSFRHNAWTDVIIGVLLYVSTLFFASNVLLLLVLTLVLLTEKRIRFRRAMALPVLFSSLALVNFSFHMEYFDPALHASSLAVVLVAVVAIVAPMVREQAFKVFVILVCAEVGVGVFEFLVGQVALFEMQLVGTGVNLEVDSPLLYETRVFGLSNNSSAFAEKLFIAIVLVFTLPELIRRRALVILVLFIGLYITFNRTAILATLLFFLLHFFIRSNVSPQRLLGSLFVIVIMACVAPLLSDVLLHQVTRGADGLTGSETLRLFYWETAATHILDNPFLGNGSLTYRIYEDLTGSFQHAHNSPLMLLATHGFFPAIFLASFIVINFHMRNWKAVIAFLMYSLTQYFIFWNLSVPDFVMFWLLGMGATPDKLVNRCSATRTSDALIDRAKMNNQGVYE